MHVRVVYVCVYMYMLNVNVENACVNSSKPDETMYNYCIITDDGWLTATTSTIAMMMIIMMTTFRIVAKIMAIIIIIIKAMRIDHDYRICEADTIVTHTTKTRCV